MHTSFIKCDCYAPVHEVLQMANYRDGSWEEFEHWIRNTIGSDFRWRVRPMDKRSNRNMIVEFVRNDIKEKNGGFPREKYVH